MGTNLTTQFIAAPAETHWNADCSGDCIHGAPNIAIVRSGERTIIAAEAHDRDHMPAIAGHLALGGIQVRSEPSVHTTDALLTAATEHYDEIVRILHEAGADLTIVAR